MIARIIFPAVIAALALPYGLLAQTFPWMTLQEGISPGLLPTIIAVVVGVLALAEASIQFSQYVRARGAPRASRDRQDGIRWPELAATGTLVASVVVAVLAIRYVGFVAAGSALVFVLSLAMGMRPVWLTALVSVAVALAVHIVFARLFGLVMAF